MRVLRLLIESVLDGHHCKSHLAACCLWCCAFFFFKQKTAFGMRISDWSSDVCSSDLLGLAMEEFDFEADELADIVGDHWAGVLWGCAFEDLLTRTIEPGDRNIVDDYIRRRGWNESGSTKIYLRALRSSVMSLYEVSE